VHLNALQSSFEFEIFGVDLADPLVSLLAPGRSMDREKCRSLLGEFEKRTVAQISKEQEEYNLADGTKPHGYILITMARFSDEHYGLKSGNVQI
jgi:hypothetical protein